MTTSFTRKLAAAGVAVAGAVGLVGINSAQSHASPSIPSLSPLPKLDLPGLVGQRLAQKGSNAQNGANAVNNNQFVRPTLQKIQGAIDMGGLGNLINLFGQGS